jgi:DNA-binding SARP family transcriptional activator
MPAAEAFPVDSVTERATPSDRRGTIVTRVDGWMLSAWGPTELTFGTERVQLRPRERAVLAALAARSPASIDTAEIVTLVWGDAPPKTARNSIQNHIARIRSVARDVVVTTDTGYRLAAEVTVNRGASLDDSEPYADLAECERTDALRSAAYVARDDAWIADMADRLDRSIMGDDAGDTIDGIEKWVARHPGDERGVRLLTRALALAGRRRDALAVIRDATRNAARSGHAPDRVLRDLARRILDDDPTLGGSSTPPADADVDPVEVGHLVGLDDYVDRIERSADDGMSLVVVTGPAGIGKTTLVEHLRDHADVHGRATLLAACSPEPSIPLEPFTEILHQLADRFPAAFGSLDDIDVLRSLAPTLAGGDDRPMSSGRVDRSVLLDAVVAALRCAPVPLTVIFEDLHWATPLTLQMLDASLAGDHDGQPVKMIVTSREVDAELVGRAVEHVVVEPWPLERVREYVGRFGRPAEWCADASAWIHRQSVGTALFIRELSVAAHASPDGEFVPPASTPDNLLASLRRTLRGLASSTQRDLGAAAILGRQFRVVEWKSMGLRSAASVDEAIAADVLERVGDDRLAFRHDLLHRLVLDELAPGERIELHDLAIDAIGSDTSLRRDRLDELSHHAYGAAPLDRARALSLMLAAVDVDTERFDYEAGIAKCRAALELLDTDARPGVVDRWTVEFEIRLGQLLLRLGDGAALDHLLGAARHALELGDDDLVAEAMREACRLGPTSVVGGVHAEASELLDRAVESVTDERAAAVVATAGVMLYAISGEYDRCRAFFERAASYHGDPGTRVDALGLAVLVLTERTDLDRRIEMERELTELSKLVDGEDARWSAAHLRMTNQVQAGDPAMRDTLAELATLTASMRQRTRLWEYTNWSASVALTDGDVGAAEQLATQALDCMDAVAESLVMSAYGAQLLSIRHAQADVGDLFDTVASIVEGGDAIGAWHAVLALAAADAGDAKRARRHLDIVVADDFAVLDRDYTFNGALHAASLAAATIGAVDIARLLASELDAWSGLWAFVGTCTMGPIDLASARLAELLGDIERAKALAGRALTSAERARAPIYVEQAADCLRSLDRH